MKLKNKKQLFLIMLLLISPLVLLYVPTVNATTDLLDSYSESNASSLDDIYRHVTDLFGDIGQTFTMPSEDHTINYVQFYMIRIGSPTGTVSAYLYAMTGTYGTDGKPTGSVLATSDAVAVNTIPTSASLITFTFSGANQVTLSADTHYSICVGGSAWVNSMNCISIYDDQTSPTHDGNWFWYTGTGWSASSARDIPFYVYGDTLPPPNPTIVYSDVGYTTNKYTKDSVFHCLWSSTGYVDGSIFGSNITGSFTNDTWTATSNWLNSTLTLTNRFDVIEYQWWANNTNNDWNTTGLLTMMVHGYNLTMTIANEQMIVNGTTYTTTESFTDQDENTAYSFQTYPNGGYSFTRFNFENSTTSTTSILNPNSVTLNDDYTVYSTLSTGGGKDSSGIILIGLIFFAVIGSLLFFLSKKR